MAKNKEVDPAELQKRGEKFQEELQKLLGKYELAIGAVAFLSPNGTVAAKIQLFDANKVKQEAEEKSQLAEA